MAAQAGKPPPVAHRARRFIQLFSGPAVALQIIRRVAGRFQRRTRRVTGVAAKWVFDFGMTHQAIRHQRQCCRRHSIRLLQAAMTGRARIGGIQIRANIAWRGKIAFRINGPRQQLGDISHLQMLLMAEMRHQCLRRRRDGHAVMALHASLLGGQVVVRSLRAGCGGDVTAHALQAQLQMQAMGKRRWRLRRAGQRQEQQPQRLENCGAGPRPALPEYAWAGRGPAPLTPAQGRL